MQTMAFSRPLQQGQILNLLTLNGSLTDWLKVVYTGSRLSQMTASRTIPIT
jgi:hypothetical protein